MQQETDMLVRAAIVMASIFVAGQALAADTLNCPGVNNAALTRGQTASTGQVVIAPPGFGELTGGASALHAQELKRIAVYAAIGNRDGAEILSSQLRQFGVTRGEVQDAIDRTHVHGGALSAPHVHQSGIQPDDNPATKVSY
jgi:hypothetical protein